MDMQQEPPASSSGLTWVDLVDWTLREREEPRDEVNRLPAGGRDAESRSRWRTSRTRRVHAYSGRLLQGRTETARGARGTRRRTGGGGGRRSCFHTCTYGRREGETGVGPPGQMDTECGPCFLRCDHGPPREFNARE